jgi:predicted DNA-binding protein YlxM (UPF0122 family)
MDAATTPQAIATRQNEPTNEANKLPNFEPVNVDLVKALKLRLINKLSFGEIAQQLNVPKTTIYEKLGKLQHLLENTELTEAYEQNKAAILTAGERLIIGHMLNEDKLKNASVNNLAYAFQQINNANRLEKGQSTSNQAIEIITFSAVQKEDTEAADQLHSIDVEPESK